jgi:hypothetical protein
MRDFDDPRKQGHTPEAASGGKPGVKTRVESRYGGVQRARAPSPTYGHLSLVPGPVMPENVFDTFALHLDPVQRVAEATALGLTDPATASTPRPPAAPPAQRHHSAPRRAPSRRLVRTRPRRLSGVQRPRRRRRRHRQRPAIGALAYATGDRVAFRQRPRPPHRRPRGRPRRPAARRRPARRTALVQPGDPLRAPRRRRRRRRRRRPLGRRAAHRRTQRRLGQPRRAANSGWRGAGHEP